MCNHRYKIVPGNPSLSSSRIKHGRISVSHRTGMQHFSKVISWRFHSTCWKQHKNLYEFILHTVFHHAMQRHNIKKYIPCGPYLQQQRGCLSELKFLYRYSMSRIITRRVIPLIHRTKHFSWSVSSVSLRSDILSRSWERNMSVTPLSSVQKHRLIHYLCH